MLKLVTQMTEEELRTEWYGLRDDSEHYDYRADGETDPEALADFQFVQDNISFRMAVISLEEERRWKALEQAAELNAYERMIEA